MARAKKTKKPAIPQSERIKNALKFAEDSFQSLQDFVQKHRDKPLSEEQKQEWSRFWDQLEEDLIKLVHLDNTQLYHPFVQHYLLSWPKNKDFLRELHRGLETGIKNRIKANELSILVALHEGREKGQSLHQIQRTLERQGLIKHISRQAFHKLRSRTLSSGDGKGPFYNQSALPPKPQCSPKHVKEAWAKADRVLRELGTRPEAKEELDDYIEERRKGLALHFPPPKTTSND